MRVHYILVMSFGFSCNQGFTQEELDLERIIDRKFGLQADDQAYEELYDRFMGLYQHPLDINTAHREEFRNLELMTDSQIEAMIKHRQQHGPFLHVLELQALTEFDMETINLIRPFLKVSSGYSAAKFRHRIATAPTRYVMVRHGRYLRKRTGYINQMGNGKAYAGSMDHVYAKLRISNPGDFSLSFALEKDAGEALHWSASSRKYGFDFHSFHLMLENRDWINKIIVGDFQVQTGQGLIQGGGFQLGKGSEPILGVRRSNVGLLPYSSATEYGFNRGIAAEIVWKSFKVLSFYSHLRRDASLRTSNDKVYYSSLRLTGLHRTVSEMESRKNITEQAIGQAVQFQSLNRELTLGLQSSLTWYDLEKVNSSLPYQRFDPTLRGILSSGAFFSYQWQNFNFFGELAHSGLDHWAGVAGFIGSLGKQVDLSLLVRNYEPGFLTTNGQAFGESSRNQNEKGTYWGIKFTPMKGISLSAHYDRFQFKWLKLGLDAPSGGHEARIGAHFSFLTNTMVDVSWRTRQKGKHVLRTGHKINQPAPGIKQNALIQMEHLVNRQISIRTRIQWSSYDFQGRKTAGFLMAQDLNLDFKRLRVNCRLALFDADDFNNRQYVYEKHVLYRVSFPSFQEVGVRSYLMLRLKLKDNLVLWARMARTVYQHIDGFGTGLDRVAGNKQSEVSTQLMWKF